MSRQSAGKVTLGRFELVERIGVGAFGEVWTARDSELDRTVAVKIPRKDQLTVEETETFLREARSAAQLRHPSIVAIHEIGKENEQLFIVSDFVKGVTLADWLSARRPTAKQAAELCAKVADAVQHAHEHKVIHRDLKPSNIMLDENGEPHIMDFGLAKREAGEVTMTVAGKVLGTPAYMSPEQAKGAAHDADERSDVYSLGVILFELVTGELPFRGNVRMLIHQVINDEAPSPRQYNGNVPRDLETICLKCLEKAPDKRYPNGEELGRDLRRFCAGKPIEARPISRFGKGLRWCQRNTAVASLAALVASLLVVIAVISALFAHRSRQELTRRRRELYISDMNVARQAWEENNVGRVVELLKRHVPDGSVPDLRGLEWYLLWNFCQRSLNTPTMQLSSDARRVAFSSDGNWLAVCSRNGKVRLRDTRTRCDLVRSFPIEGRRFHEFFVAFTPHDKSVAFPGNTVSTITILDLSSHQQRPITVGGEDPIIDIDFSPDGTVAAVAIADGSIAILDFQSGNIFKRWKAHERYTTSVVYSPDGSVLVSSGRDATVRLWDAVSTKEIKTFHSEDQVWSLAFSSDGSRLASAGWDKLIRIVEMATQEEIEVLTPGQGKLRAVAFSDDGRMLASAGRDNTVKLWNARTFSEIDTFKGHSSLVWSVAFQPTSKTLASGSMDNTVMLWNVETPNEQRVLPANYQVRDLAFTADSGTLATLEYLDDKVRLWDTEDGRRLAPISVDSPLLEFAVSACKTLAAGGQDGLITLCDLSQNECSITIESGLETVRALSFSPDGRLVAAASFDEVALWNADNGQLHQRFEDVGQALAFSPTGEMIATVSHDNRIVVKDVASGSLVENFPGHKDAVSSLAFSPTGDVLASGSLDMTAKVWKIGQPDPLAAFQVWARIWDLTFSGGKGNTLITVAGDGDVEFWDMGSHQHRFTLRMDGRSGMSVAVSPDERFLAAGSLNDDTLRLWRAATPEEVAACEPWQDIVNGKR